MTKEEYECRIKRVKKQLKASANWEFDCIKEIKKAKVIR